MSKQYKSVNKLLYNKPLRTCVSVWWRNLHIYGLLSCLLYEPCPGTKMVEKNNKNQPKRLIMIWCFTSFSTLFKLYRDDGRVIMKGSVHRRSVSQELNFKLGTSWSKSGGLNIQPSKCFIYCMESLPLGVVADETTEEFKPTFQIGISIPLMYCL